MKNLLEINEGSVYLACYHDEEEGETRVEMNGQVVRKTNDNFKDVRIIVALRDAKNRVLRTEEDWVDDGFEDDILEFSIVERVPTKLLKKAKVIEIQAKAQFDPRSPKLSVDLTKAESFKESSG